MTTNLDLYRARNEPPEVKQGSTYISLETCTDVTTLRSLAGRLNQHGHDAVLLAWLGPDKSIQGYGIYAKQEAEQLRQRSKDETGFLPGESYDSNTVRWRISMNRSPVIKIHDVDPDPYHDL